MSSAAKDGEAAIADQCASLLAGGPLDTLTLWGRLRCGADPSTVYRACANDPRMESTGQAGAVTTFRLRATACSGLPEAS